MDAAPVEAERAAGRDGQGLDGPHGVVDGLVHFDGAGGVAGDRDEAVIGVAGVLDGEEAGGDVLRDGLGDVRAARVELGRAGLFLRAAGEPGRQRDGRDGRDGGRPG